MTTVMRWFGYILGALIALLVASVLGVFSVSEYRINAAHEAPTPSLVVSSDPAVIARGEHIANHISPCVECHGPDLGGKVFLDDPLLGLVVAPNLTTGRGGVGAKLSDADMARVLRYGVKPDGTSVVVMPSNEYMTMSDADMTAVISFVRSMPPVDREMPENEWGPLGRLLTATDLVELIMADKIDVEKAIPSRVAPGPTAEYGHYLATIAGCTNCHGEGLSGGPIAGAPADWPPAANISRGGVTQSWTEADFIQTLRTGIDPGGHEINPVMPAKLYGGMSDDELKALWAFIQSMPAKEYGNH